MTIFERVKKISKQRGFSSLQVLSETAGLSPNVVYGWKKNQPSATAKTMATSLYGTSMKSIEPFDVNKEEIDPLYKDRKSEITLGDIATFKK